MNRFTLGHHISLLIVTYKYFEILIPPYTMTLQKAPIFLYGLKNFKSFLDNNIHKQSSLKRTINSNESTGFYVAMLCPS